MAISLSAVAASAYLQRLWNGPRAAPPSKTSENPCPEMVDLRDRLRSDLTQPRLQKTPQREEIETEEPANEEQVESRESSEVPRSPVATARNKQQAKRKRKSPSASTKGKDLTPDPSDRGDNTKSGVRLQLGPRCPLEQPWPALEPRRGRYDSSKPSSSEPSSSEPSPSGSSSSQSRPPEPSSPEPCRPAEFSLRRPRPFRCSPIRKRPRPSLPSHKGSVAPDNDILEDEPGAHALKLENSQLRADLAEAKLQVLRQSRSARAIKQHDDETHAKEIATLRKELATVKTELSTTAEALTKAQEHAKGFSEERKALKEECIARAVQLERMRHTVRIHEGRDAMHNWDEAMGRIGETFALVEEIEILKKKLTKRNDLLIQPEAQLAQYDRIYGTSGTAVESPSQVTELTAAVKMLGAELEEATELTRELGKKLGKQAREIQECHDMIHILQMVAPASEEMATMAQHLASTQQMLRDLSEQHTDTKAKNERLREINVLLDGTVQIERREARKPGDRTGKVDDRMAREGAEVLDYHFRALIEEQENYIKFQRRQLHDAQSDIERLKSGIQGGDHVAEITKKLLETETRLRDTEARLQITQTWLWDTEALLQTARSEPRDAPALSNEPDDITAKSQLEDASKQLQETKIALEDERYKVQNLEGVLDKLYRDAGLPSQVEPTPDSDFVKLFLEIEEHTNSLVWEWYNSLAADRIPKLPKKPPKDPSPINLAELFNRHRWGSLTPDDRQLQVRAAIYHILHATIFSPASPSHPFNRFEPGDPLAEEGLQRFESLLLNTQSSPRPIATKLISLWRTTTLHLASQLPLTADTSYLVAFNHILQLVHPILWHNSLLDPPSDLRRRNKSGGDTRGDIVEAMRTRSKILDICLMAWRLRVMMRRAGQQWGVETMGGGGYVMQGDNKWEDGLVEVKGATGGKMVEREVDYVLFGALVKREAEGELKVLVKAGVVVKRSGG
ncbi:hypothetical protein QBC34DRAFT_496484 [Podospora aff. communis PSN243]|uniref:Uncharacterized protein n=1 Tax=Podospora aff. communis PSN243 TaxID=3040156 RepID=A0AAV9GFH8_9PEZI|nr:hypothetical protein QBC34DRAFT_496484 [Podospora aff. communis PSN243]